MSKIKNVIEESTYQTGQFKYSGNAEITHLNTRKEGAEDSKELAIDVKLKIKTGSDALKYFQSEQLIPALWNDIGAIRNIKLDPICMSYELRSYTVDMAGNTFYDVKLKKFSFEPIDGNLVAITFQASMSPRSNEVAQIAEYLQDEVQVKLEPSNAELDFTAENISKSENNESKGDDVLYAAALVIVAATRKPSVSAIQRELRIGYNRAARLVERMESEGLVSKMDLNGSRKVLEAA